MNHYVYRLSHPDGYEYTGIRSCTCKPELDTAYLGSGIKLAKAKKIVDNNLWFKQIIYVGKSRKCIMSRERELVTKNYIKLPHVLNLAVGGSCWHNYGIPHTIETKAKMSKSIKIAINREETKAKISAGLKLSHSTTETKLKLSKNAKEAQLGRVIALVLIRFPAKITRVTVEDYYVLKNLGLAFQNQSRECRRYIALAKIKQEAYADDLRVLSKVSYSSIYRQSLISKTRGCV